MTPPSGSERLTEAQKEMLRCCDDWTAPIDVADRLQKLDSPLFAMMFIDAMRDAVKRGLVEHHSGNNTYRLTPAGRAALARALEGGKK